MDFVAWFRAEWDRVTGLVLLGLGTLFVLVSVLQARDAALVTDQFSFIMSGAFGGAVALAAGSTLVIAAGLHDEWRHLHRIEALLSPASGFDNHKAPDADSSLPVGGIRWLRVERGRVFGAALVLVAAVVISMTYRQLAASPSIPDQLAHMISGGLGGLLVLLAGSAVFLAEDVRDTAAKIERLKGTVRADLPGLTKTDIKRAGSFAAVGAVVGAGLILAGWRMAATTADLDQAFQGLFVGTTGFALAVIGVGIAGLRLRERSTPQPFVRRLGAPTSADNSGSDRHVRTETALMTTARMTRYHRPSCQALRFAKGEVVDASPRRNELEGCLICEAGEG